MTKKKKRFQELKLMTKEQLVKEESNIKKKLFEMRLQETGRKGLPVENPHLYKKYRREIAQIKTILNQQ